MNQSPIEESIPGPTLPFPRLLFALCLLIVAALVFVAPVATPETMMYLMRAVRSRDVIAVAGNSIWSHISLCDTDQRTLARLIQDDTQHSTLDLSHGGQSLNEGANFIALSLRKGHSQTAVLGVSLPELSAFDNSGLQESLLYRLADPSVAEESLLQRAHGGHLLEGPPDPGGEGFSYANKTYPDYNGITQQYFEPQSQRPQTCPEDNGTDPRFETAYYHHAYISFDVPQQNIDLLGSLAAIAQAHGKRFLVVLMPLDYELMDLLQPNMGQTARERAIAAAAALHARGVEVLDLSALLHNSAFADRFCACGHLQQEGREQVAAHITDALRAGIPAGGR